MKLIKWRKDRSVWETEWRINGKRKRSTLKGFTKSQQSEARAFALHLYLKDLKGDLHEECQTTFKDMSEVYFRNRGEIRDNGKNYRMDILYQFVGEVKLNEIGFAHYEAIKKYLKIERKCKNQSINRYLADLGAVMNLAKRQQVIKDFPPILKLENEQERLKRNLTLKEIEIIRSVITPYLRDPFEFALSSGWRKANLVGLTRKHLTRKIDGTWQVNFTAMEMKGKVAFEHHCSKLETENINRNISLEHEYIFRRDIKLNGAKDKGLGDFKKAFQSTREKCGFYWTWHWTRHTCSTVLGQEGVSDRQMNSLMAWSPKSRMAGNYTHMRNENLIDLRQSIENRGHHMDTKKQNRRI